MAFLFDMLGAGLNYKADKAKYKAQKRMQEWRNKMTNIANAINQDAITQNTTFTIQQAAKQSVYMKKDELSAVGATKVAAAAAGVRGNSVNSTLRDVQRKFSLRTKQKEDDLEQYFIQTHNQRIGSAMSAAQNQDYSYIPKPSFGTYLLGAVSKNMGAETTKQFMLGGMG